MYKFDRAYFEEGGCGSSYKDGYSREKVIQYWKNKIVYIIKKAKPTRSLEIGCAKGFLVDELRHYGVQAFGVDVSEYALSSAPESLRSYLRQVNVSYESLPFPDDYFDLIICLETLEHLVEPDHAIKEMARVLAPKGTAFFSTPSPDQPEEREDKTHCNIRSFEQWLDSFKRCGMIAKIIPVWKMERSKGRLGKFPFRTIIRSLFYPIKTFFLGEENKPLYIEAHKIL